MTGRKRRRSYPLVNKSHQYRFLAIILTYNLIILGSLAVFFFLPDIITLKDQNLSFELRAAAADKILTLHCRLWPAVIALICLIGIHSFHVFHRFIGPLYRLTWAFGQVTKGNLSFRLRLRRKDYLHEEGDAFNKMLERLAEKIESTQIAGERALKELGKLKEETGEGNGWNESHKENLSRLHRNLEIMMDSAQYFQTQRIEDG